MALGLSNSGFGSSQTSLLLSSAMVLAIKFLDITKFGFFELGGNSDKNAAVGAVAVVVVLFVLVSFVSLLAEMVRNHIYDNVDEEPKIPDFSSREDYISPGAVRINFWIQDTLFFILKVLPVIVGITTILLVRRDLAYFLIKLWDLLLTGGGP